MAKRANTTGGTRKRKRAMKSTSKKVANTEEAELEAGAENPAGTEDAAAQIPADAPAAMDAASILGHVAWLMMQAPNYRYTFVSDLERVILPPIVHKNFKLYRKNRIPVGFVSWAYLTEEAEERLMQDASKLKPEDWATRGDRLWIIDQLTPFGGLGPITKDLRENVFKDEKEAKALRQDKDGTIRVVRFLSEDDDESVERKLAP